MIVADQVRYAPDGRVLLDGFSLQMELGKVTALVGPSGCGKSTLLRVIAGLRPLDGGALRGVPARKAFVFQDAALLPWLDARANVALPGRYAPIGDVDAALAAVGLSAQAAQLPRTLSGGQRMRVSIARALVCNPELVLLDEAFSALDGVTRRSLQETLFDLQRANRWTVLMVTHELDDAVRLADRVVALAGPPLRVVADIPIPTPRTSHADPAIADHLRSVYA